MSTLTALQSMLPWITGTNNPYNSEKKNTNISAPAFKGVVTTPWAKPTVTTINPDGDVSHGSTTGVTSFVATAPRRGQAYLAEQDGPVLPQHKDKRNLTLQSWIA